MKNKSILSYVSQNVFFTYLNFFLSFITITLLARNFKLSEIGEFNHISYLLITLYAFTHFGLNQYFVRLAIQSNQNFYSPQFFVCLLQLILTVLAIPVINKLYHYSYTHIILLSAASYIKYSLINIFLLKQYSDKKLTTGKQNECFSNILLITLLYGIIFSSFPFHYYYYIFFISTVFFLIYSEYCFNIFRSNLIKFRETLNFNLNFKYIKDARFFFLSTIAMSVTDYVDVIMLGYFHYGSEIIGIYSMVIRLMFTCCMFAIIIIQTLYHDIFKNPEFVKTKMFPVFLHILMIFITILLLTHKFFLPFFFKENGKMLVPVFYVYIFELVSPFMLGCSISYAKGKNNDRLVLILSMAVGIVNLILDYIFGKYYGPIGIAYATIISLSFISIGSIWIVLKKKSAAFYLIFIFCLIFFSRSVTVYILVLLAHSFFLILKAHSYFNKKNNKLAD